MRNGNQNQLAATLVSDKELHCLRMEELSAEADDVRRYLTGESRTRGLRAIHVKVMELRASYGTIERVERRLCGVVGPQRKTPAKGYERR